MNLKKLKYNLKLTWNLTYAWLKSKLMTTYSPCRVYRRLRDGSFLFQTEVTGAWERTPLPGSSSGQLGSSHCEHLQKRIIVFLYTVSLLPAHFFFLNKTVANKYAFYTWIYFGLHVFFVSKFVCKHIKFNRQQNDMNAGKLILPKILMFFNIVI